MPLKKRADNRYQKTVRYERPDGSRARKVIYGLTQQELKQKTDAFLAQVAAGQRIGAGDCTVQEWAKEWRETYKAPFIGEKTMAGYQRDLDIINAAIGYKRIKDVQKRDLQAILSGRMHLSGSAIRKTLMTIKALFRAAAVDRMIPYSPAEGIKLPKGLHDGSHRALTKEELADIHAAAGALEIRTRQPHRFALPVMLMIYAGLRRGEVAAFDLSSDVDLDGGLLHISRSVSYVTNEPQVKRPKSRAGIRTVPIFPPLRPFLEGRSGFAARPSTSSQARNVERNAGLPITRQAFHLAFREFMAMAGVDCTPHDLRHTFFTILYDAGVDVKTAQRWGGHATAAVTMNIYTHLSAERETTSADLVSAYLSRCKDSQIDSKQS